MFALLQKVVKFREREAQQKAQYTEYVIENIQLPMKVKDIPKIEESQKVTLMSGELSSNIDALPRNPAKNYHGEKIEKLRYKICFCLRTNLTDHC